MGRDAWTSVEEARAMVRAGLDEGVTCPCCGKYARRYSRKFNKSMARSLLWLAHTYVHREVRDWVDVPNLAPRWLVRTNQLATVRWWGLVERRPTDATDSTKHSGLWRPTKAGLRFAHKQATIPSRAITYNGRVEELVGDPMTLADVLGVNFNYASLFEIER